MPRKFKINSEGSYYLAIIIGLSCLAAGIAVGVWIGVSWTGKDNIAVSRYPDSSCPSYQQALADLKTRFIATGFMGKGGVTSLSGRVTEIKPDSVTFTAALPSPLLDDSLKTRTALITDKTEVVLLKTKTPEQYKKDLADGNSLLKPAMERVDNLKKTVDNCGAATSSECVKAKADLETASAEVIKINDSMSPTSAYDGKPSDLTGVITVTAVAASDISSQSSFSAQKIELTENTIAPITSLPDATTN